VREKERERGTENERERQKERQIEREKQRERERERKKEREEQKERDMCVTQYSRHVCVKPLTKLKVSFRYGTSNTSCGYL